MNSCCGFECKEGKDLESFYITLSAQTTWLFATGAIFVIVDAYRFRIRLATA